MRRIVWWARRDLRLTDNLTLHSALRDAASVIPVFILDPKLWQSRKLAPARRQFLCDALADLDAQLRERGARLIVREGEPARELERVVNETQADAVYFHRDFTPFARQRDARVIAALAKLGARVETFDDNYLAAPEQIAKDDGAPYVVFTRFRLRFEERVGLPMRFSARGDFGVPPEIASNDLPRVTRDPRVARGGETVGAKLARAFVRRDDGLRAYAATRNDLARDATSHLSPHLHFGTVSVRELVRAARAADAGQPGKAWLDELVWREFYMHVLYHFPHAARGAFKREYAALPWENDRATFAAWCEGLTGYPVVDAALRQLNETGWMHNRARMIVASFLTKDLLIDWRWGEKYFLQNLVDGDVAANNGGWQWAASTGTDAQPFFRIFNPVLQGARFDASGAYVRRWLPELGRVPTKYLHAPWTMPADIARQAGITLGKTYPAPMVEHALQRERALRLYRKQKSEG